MKNRLMRLFVAAVFMILALPAVSSAQIYNPNYDRDSYRNDRRDAREAIARLDNVGARLENDLRAGSGRRVLGGLVWVGNVNNNAVAEVRNFRMAVQDLRRSSRGAGGLDRGADEAR